MRFAVLQIAQKAFFWLKNPSVLIRIVRQNIAFFAFLFYYIYIGDFIYISEYALALRYY